MRPNTPTTTPATSAAVDDDADSDASAAAAAAAAAVASFAATTLPHGWRSPGRFVIADGISAGAVGAARGEVVHQLADSAART